ncbi:DUF998 domain-containing protein [Motiliproteus sp. MSK22-1]|uniref:DUF998 domain-containing protein n=1 Tax=Motiliproteus sp. MSK22-1 TaxID=1897630 RepID=UPI000975D281|nr:DUF998 domain-containing protein [Motiliproteus sp. MSK22-1]OMH37984.1 hypothetical protein BGP75_06765 [Motiliproteus sp. MSK22-1]
MRKFIIYLPVASAFWFVTTITLGGINHPNYQHMSQFISELGAVGTINGQTVNLIGFVPASIFLTAFVILAIYLSSRKTKQTLGFVGIGMYAITLCIAALYPCDAGCRPDSPTTSQIIHNLSAIFGYLNGIAGVFILASDVKQKGNRKLGIIGYVLGSVAVAMFFLLYPEFLLVGLAQRIFELSMYTWIILYSFYFQVEILNKSSKKDAVNRASS